MRFNYLFLMLMVYTGIGILIGVIFSYTLPEIIPIPSDYRMFFNVASIAAGILLGIINYLLFYSFVTFIIHYFYDLLNSVRNGDLSIRSRMKSSGILGQFSATINRTIADLEKTHITILHDNLTGLPNRQSLQRFFLDEDPHENEKQYALYFLDMNNFKDVNDTYGHAIGDEVLKYISKIINIAKGLENRIYRLSGDEFVIIQNLNSTSRQSTELCKKIHHSFTQPFLSENMSIQISVSIGVYEFTYGEEDFTSIINKADQAMYFAKKNPNVEFVKYGEQERLATLIKK